MGGSQYNRSILAATTHTCLAYHAKHFNSQKSYLKTPLFCIETDKHKYDDDSDVMSGMMIVAAMIVAEMIVAMGIVA